MIYVTDKTVSVVLSSVIVLLLTFILYPSVLVAILPSAILLYLLVSLIMFRPKISITSYITPDIVVFGEIANVRIKIGSLKKVYVEVYDNLPNTVEVVDGKPCYRGVLDKGTYVEFTYSILPLIPGLHEWGPLRVHVRDPLGLFENVIFFEIPRKLSVRPPKTHTKMPFRIPAYGVSSVREHYEPLFDRVKPYAPGDSLKRIVFRSMLMPGGLRVKSFISEAHGKMVKPQELRVMFLISRNFAHFFRRAYSLALYGVYRVFIECSMLGRSFSLAFNNVSKQVESFNELYRVLSAYNGMSDDELLATLMRGFEGIIIVDYLTLLRFRRRFLRIDAPILVIMPIPDNYELLSEIRGLDELLKELKRKYLREVLTLNLREVRLISYSMDFEKFLEEVI